MSLSLEGLEEILAFFRRSLLTRFVVLGGEPTLHPNFTGMIDHILTQTSLKSIVIFTNGIMPDPALDYLSGCADPRLGVALNLNAPEDYTAGEWKRITQTMEMLGPRINLGLNISRPGQDFEYLVSAIESYRLSSHIRIGLTQPILGFQNRYAQEEDLPGIAEDVVTFAERAFRRKIGFSFDCGFRFCMFTLEQHKRLLRFAVKFAARCSPIIDIGPDLNVWPCFPLHQEANRRLSEFQTENQIIDFYKETYKSFLPMGNRANCPQCLYRVNQMCSGGCLARTLASFRR